MAISTRSLTHGSSPWSRWVDLSWRLVDHPRFGPGSRYLFAVLAVVLATLLREVLSRVYGPAFPATVVFYPMVLAAALIGGVGPGLLASCLAGITAAYFLPPQGLPVGSPIDQMTLGLFCGVNVLLSLVCGTLRSARQRSAAEVRRATASEERFRLFMDNTPALVWVKDEHGRYVYLNRAYETRFRVALADCLGKTDQDLWAPEVAARLQQADRAALAAGQSIELIEDTTEPDGTRSFWLNHKFPLLDAAGARLVASIGVDITARVRGEDDLREQLFLNQVRADSIQTMQQPLPLAELLQALASLLVERLDAALVRVWTLSPDGRTLHMQASAGLYTHTNGPHGCVPVGQLKIGRIANLRKPLLTNQVLGDPDISDQDWARREKLVAFAGFPLLAEGRLLGVVALFARHALSPAVLNTLDALAATLAEAIGRKQAQQALLAEKEFADYAINSLPGIFYLFDGRNRLLRWNHNFETVSGYSSAELPGLTTLDLIAPQDRPAASEAIARVLESGEASAELLFLTRSGTTIPFAFTGRRLTVSGEPGFLGVGLDITERRRAEADLRASEGRLRKVISTPTVGVLFFDLTGRMQEANLAFQRMSGYTAEELCVLNWKALTAPEFWEVTLQHAAELANQGETTPYEKVMLRKDGSRWWGLFAPMRLSGSGQHSECMEFVIDITDRKRFQEAMQESEARLRLAVETAELGMYEHDYLARQLTLNPTCQAILGASEPFPSDLARRALHPEDRDRVLAEVARAFDPNLRAICSAEFRLVRPDGSVRWVAGRGRVLFDDRAHPPQPIRFIGVLNDITQRKRLEAQLQAHTAHLEDLVRERTSKLQASLAELEHFSYTITHDLRAPLRAMRGFADILDGTHAQRLPCDAQDLLHRISGAALRMDQLITDALAYSTVIRSEMPLHPVDPAALLKGMVESYPQFQPPLAEVLFPASLPWVLGNEAALTQCFSNLLGNAVKFVAKGVTPHIRILAEEIPPDSPTHVRLYFRDNGIGIPREYHDKIWRMFERVHTDYEGTGIGLALVRKVVDRMGGRIGVESDIAQGGSCFWIELPYAAANPPGQAVPRDPQNEGTTKRLAERAEDRGC